MACALYSASAYDSGTEQAARHPVSSENQAGNIVRLNQTQYLGPKDPLERAVIEFDFTAGLGPTETISAPFTVLVTLIVNGSPAIDPSPGDILQGVNEVDDTGKVVLVAVQGGVDSLDYAIKCIPTCSNPVKAPALTCVLPVREGA